MEFYFCFNQSIQIDLIGLGSLPYFAKPVGFRDGDVIGAEVSAAPVPVENGSQVREVAVEVDVLGVCPTIGPTVQQVTLKGRHWNQPKTCTTTATVCRNEWEQRLRGENSEHEKVRTRKRVRLSSFCC